jgi:uncharacterized protein
MRFTRTARLLVDGQEVGEIREARGPIGRLLGLMGRAQIPSGRGLLFTHCSSVHTCFMRFPIDVVYLDDAGRVQKVSYVWPWRVSAARGAKAVIEFPLGDSARLGIVPGARVEVAR